jgi:hypothetical protein
VVGAAAVAAALLRVAYFWQPLSSDEGGFLLVASQWRPGTSLYGDYWVDRPPLLVDLFWVADRLGGIVGLRVIGLVMVMIGVLLAGAIGRLVRPPAGKPDALRSRTMTAPAVTAAVFLVSPLSGAVEVNGELLAVPFVLIGLALALVAGHPGAHRRAALVGAGAAGAAAMVVKQNEIDVFVFMGVALFLSGAPARSQVRRRGALPAGCVTGSTLGGSGTGRVTSWLTWSFTGVPWWVVSKASPARRR